jgi:hypothetical protein
MNYITKSGIMKHPYILGNKRIDEMCERGWRIKLVDSYHETPQELYNRLSELYEDVRIYEDTTRIRGLHTIFAMCR